jgi:hypothetical protein
MKLNVNIDLSNDSNDLFEYDGGGEYYSTSITENLRRLVVNDVISHLSSSIPLGQKNELYQHIMNRVTALTDDDFLHIKETMTISGYNIETLINDKIKYFYENFKVEEHIEKLINEKFKKVIRDIESEISKKVDSFSKELMSRYDAQFANMIVNSMQKNNLLSGRAVSLLFGGDTNETVGAE